MSSNPALPPRILITGYYGFGNTGDEAILAAMVAQLRKRVPGCRLAVLSGEPERTLYDHPNVTAIHLDDLSAVVAATESADMVICGGGGLFHDYWGIDPDRMLCTGHWGISFFAGIPLLAELTGKPVIMYGVGVGPLFSESARQITRTVFNMASAIMVRDSASKQELVDLGVEPSRIQVTADPAFALPLTSQAPPSFGDEAGLRIGVVVRHWDVHVHSGYWERCVAEALDQFAAEVNGRILFVPFQAIEGKQENDRAVIQRIRGQMAESKRAHQLDAPLPPAELAALLGECDLVLGMRLHSLIFAALSGVPMVALSYDPKVASLMERLELKDFCLNLEDISAGRLRGLLRRATELPPEGRERLRAAAATLRALAEENADRAVELLGTSVAPTLLDEPGLPRLLAQVIASQARHLHQAEITIRQEFEGELEARQAEVQALEEQVQALEAQVQALEAQVQALEAQVAERDKEILAIHSSKLWHLASLYWDLRKRLGHVVSMRALTTVPLRLGRRILPAPVKRLLRRHYTPPDAGRVSLSPDRLYEAPDARLTTGPTRYEIVCLPIIEWKSRYQRPQQLPLAFADQGHRIFYVDPGGLVGGLYADPSQVDIRVEVIKPNVHLVNASTRTTLNIYRHTLEEENLEYLFKALQILRERYELINPVCLVQLPFWAPLALKVQETFDWKVIYDCMDDHSGFSTNSPNMVAFEESLARQSDLVIATSRPLLEKMQVLNQNCIRVPNAADFDHFNRAVPDDPLKDIPRPIIGYYGAISEWFDMDLVRAAAVAHPEWSFVLIGSTFGADYHADISRLHNVHFLGEQPYELLPQFLHQFDACCIPFKLTPLTKATNPVKFFEFLSAGKPVVSVRLPELEPYEAHAYLADGPQEFVAQLERALEEDSATQREARIEFARENTWAARRAQVEEALRQLFEPVSIVIVTWNNLSLTQACVQSIFMNTGHPNIQLVIVDNGSTDGTRDYLLRLQQEHPEQVDIILNDDNQGFARANNQAIEAATGQYIVFLNNDVIVTRGWLTRLLKHLGRPEVGMVGPVTNYCGNEARIPVTYSSLEEMQAFAAERARQFAGKGFEMEMLGFYCLAIKREVLDEVGPLDERFEVGMFEDDDFCLRVHQRGYKLLCAEDVFIHHFGGASFQSLSHSEYHRIWDRNRQSFEEKWGLSWQPGIQGLTADQQLARILSSHRDVRGVIIAPPTVDWGYMFQRPQQMAMAMARKGYLFFYCTPNFKVDQVEGFLRVADKLYVCHVPFELFDRVEKPILLIHWPLNRRYLDSFHRRPTVIYDVLDELEVFPTQGEAMRRDHASLLEEADLVLTASRRLHHKISAIRPDAICCPNGVEYEAFASATEKAHGRPPQDIYEIVALGNPIVGYYGALSAWVDYELIAAVAEQRPQYAFVLIGPDHDGSLARSALGTLENLSWLGTKPYQHLPYYLGYFDVATIPFKINEVTLSVSPIKLFEYMAAGKPVVSTPLPECQQFEEVLVAGSPPEFALALDKALERGQDAAWRSRLQATARENSWDARAEVVASALARICGSGPTTAKSRPDR